MNPVFKIAKPGNLCYSDSGGMQMRLLFYLLQWTWGLPQNLLGFLLWLRFRKCPRSSERCAAVTRLTGKHSRRGSLSLGMFVFVDDSGSEETRRRTLVHEYGHSLQSLILGPLFLPVIAIPSAIWAGFRWQRHPGRLYSSFYPERWANRLGEKAFHRPSIDW